MGFLDPIKGLSKPDKHTGERNVSLVQLYMLIFHLSRIIDIHCQMQTKMAVNS